MCGRYSNTAKKSDDLQAKMADLLGVSLPESDRGFERFNIAPTQEVLAAVDDEDGRRIEPLRWGLVPKWAKDGKAAFKMINARAETVLDKPAYRNLIRRAKHRCLIWADGWYEWQKPEDPKQPRRPMHFSLQDRTPFCFAGLWTNGTCTIVTCEANDVARPIHNRMPVVMADQAAWDAWLNPGLDGEAVSELLVPLAPALLRVGPANPVMNSGKHEGADCLDLSAASLPAAA